MAREEPNNVPQITELHKFKKLAPAIHVFNSIVLDDSTRWYAEKICPAYFATRTEYDQYIKKINGNKPMDFGTIRKNILNHKYKKSSSKLFHDMELVFKNAMAYNNKGNQWHEPARRLYTILQFMKGQNVIEKEQFIPAMNNCKTCPQCNNIMLPTKTITTRRCSQCSTNISGQRMDCFICHNHSDQSHSFCIKCVQKKCQKCFNWHAGKRCDTKKKGSNGTNKRSRTKARDDNNWGLTQINLQVPPKPYNIQTVTSFDKVECNPTFNARIETMIKQIKAHDTEMHFFKKVDHPLYAQLVKNPIHFGQILKRINKNKYDTMGEIKRDIDLLWNNCYTFNGPPNADDKTNASAFANFAHDLQWALDEYIKQFETNLTKQNWIGSKSTGSSSVHSSPKVSKKSSKHKEKIKNESKKKKKHKHKHKKNSSSSTDHEDHVDNQTTNKINVKELVARNNSIWEMSPAPAASIEPIHAMHHKKKKKKKKRNRSSYASGSDNEIEILHQNKKPRIAPSSSPPLSGISVSSTEMNQAPTIPLAPTPPNTHSHIPQKRKFDNFEFGSNANIEAPPAKKRKIATSDPSVYVIPPNMMNNYQSYHANAVNNVMPHAHVSNMNTMHPMQYPSSRHRMHHATATSVAADVDPSLPTSARSQLSPSHHSRVHTSPTTTYNPTISEFPEYRLSDSRSVLHTHPSMAHSIHGGHNMMPQPYVQSYTANTPQQLFIQPQYPIQSIYPNQFDSRMTQIPLNPNHHPSHPVPNTTSSNTTKRNKIKKLKLKRSSAISQQSQPASYNPIEYHLDMAEKLMGARASTNMPANAGSLRAGTANASPPLNNNIYAEPIIVSNGNGPQQSTVTTSTSSSINSQPHLQTITQTTHSTEYTDHNVIYAANHSHVIEKIIKGIYSKAISLDTQDQHHPAKRFETIDKFPQPHGMQHIAIFDIHQKLADNKDAYKALWEVYYDFASIWTPQIHFNTNVRDIALAFAKYVDEIFTNVLEDGEMFENTKRQALEELQKAMQPQRIKYNSSAQSVVDTVAYTRAEHLFPVKMNTNQIQYLAMNATPNINTMAGSRRVVPDLKRMQRITSNITDDSECKPILPAADVSPQFVDRSMSPVMNKSASIAPHNDKISVASSHHSKSSSNGNANVRHPTPPNHMNTTPVAVHLQSEVIAPPPRKHKSRKESKKKKKEKKKKKKLKKAKKEDVRKASTIKSRPSTMKTRPPTNKARPSVLKTRPHPVVKPAVVTAAIPMMIPKKSTPQPKPIIPKADTAPKPKQKAKANPKKIKLRTKPKAVKAKTAPIVIDDSPPPPDMLVHKLNEMSESESIVDASPFLKQNTVSFAQDIEMMDHVPSPPTFSFDDDLKDKDCANDHNDNCSVNTTMTMGLNGRNANDLMGRIGAHKNRNTMNDEEKTPFKLTKIPKKAAVCAVPQDEPLKIAIDSDDDDDVIAEQQIQEAHKREIAERQRRQKEKEAKENATTREKEAKEKVQAAAAAAEKQKNEKQKKSNHKSRRIKITHNRKKSHQAKAVMKAPSPPLKPLQSIINTTRSKPVRANLKGKRSKTFGDHVFKEQFALRVYHEFKRTPIGKIFDNENEILGRYGMNASEMIAQNTFALRLIPYMIERQELVNLPHDLSQFCFKLFDLAQKKAMSRSQEMYYLAAKFAKYHFKLLHKCCAMNPDFGWRRQQRPIEAKFMGKKWVRLVHELKEKCISAHYVQLFQPFDPAVAEDEEAELSCAAIRLWRRANDPMQLPVTFYEIEVKLHAQLYGDNNEIKHDMQRTLDNLQEIFHDNERYRKFIATLRDDWIDFKTKWSTKQSPNQRESLGAYHSRFDSVDDCVSYYYNQKSEAQKAMAPHELVVEKIIEDRIVVTRSEGKCSLFCVQYKDHPHDLVWEPRMFMLRYYREDTKLYMRSKKKAYLGVLLTHPNNLQAHKAFLNERAAWIPRYDEQFGPRHHISEHRREEINRIASRKAAQLRKTAKQKRQMDAHFEKESAAAADKKKKKNVPTMNENCHLWTETVASSLNSRADDESSFQQEEPLSFSFCIAAAHRIKSNRVNPLFVDDDDDVISINNEESQSILSQIEATLSTTNNEEDDDVGVVEPLAVLTSALSNGSADDEDVYQPSSLTIQQTPSILPTPPPMPFLA
eukprot:680403_1